MQTGAVTGNTSAITPGRLVRDEFLWPFVRVPMAGAPRSVVIPLANNLHVAFDVKTLRTHTAWQGGFIHLAGRQFNASSTAQCDFDGATIWTMPPLCPWRAGARPIDPVQEMAAGSDFRGISTKGGVATLFYDVASDTDAAIRIHESPRAQTIGGASAVVRRFEISPHQSELWFLAHEETNRFIALSTNGTAWAAPRGTNILVSVVRGGSGSFQAEGSATNRTRLWLQIPPSQSTIVLEIASAVCPSEAEARKIVGLAIECQVDPPQKGSLTASASEVRQKVPFIVRGGNAPARIADGKFFTRESFPVPKELDLLVGGMDWLPNGELLVSTWPGEVYVIQGATGAPTEATYRRFASGLQEPLGLKVVHGQVYVVQKCELTRLTDTDGDGEADLYESINDDWGYDGDMHYFAYGPACDAQGNFYVTLDANTMAWKPRWELPFRGWTVKISPDGRTMEGVAAGLRSPNGCFAIGNDVFCTDNEGHWLGTCKLNHCKTGRFFGYPSSTPMPRETFEKPNGFDPPAVWLPRRLSTSASGGVTIPDERFGPFQGQLLVGDFGTSSILRVALEKVNGEWQGAVWPFARGFLSGVNRLSFGPDGRLYVGCLRRGWSSSGPQEFSLERVAYTGSASNAPFEVREVHALPDGFELLFTGPVDAGSASPTDGWNVAQFGYKFHAAYGSPECDQNGKENSATSIAVTHAIVSADARRVQLKLSGWKAGFVTTVQSKSVRSAQGEPLQHDTFYYTLNQIPK